MDIKKLEDVKSGLKVAGSIAGATITVINTMQKFSQDQAKLNEIHSAIRANQVALRDLADYEKTVQSNFRPMLQHMVNTFDKYKANLTSDNTFEIEFRKYTLLAIL